MAVKSIKGGMSIAGAARLYKVPKTTLWEHIRGRCTDSPKEHRKRTTILTEEEENALAEYCKLKAKTGMALRRIDIAKVCLVRMQVIHCR